MKPFSASDVLRNESPRKMIQGTFLTTNRYSELQSSRDSSPCPGSPASFRDRSRSASTKRKSSNDLSYAGAASQNVLLPEPNTPLECNNNLARCVDQLNVNFAKVNSLCDKACSDISETSCDPNIIAVFTLLCDAVKVVNSSQGELTKLIENQGSQPPPLPPPATQRARPVFHFSRCSS
jgi:hypothetical protein